MAAAASIVLQHQANSRLESEVAVLRQVGAALSHANASTGEAASARPAPGQPAAAVDDDRQVVPLAKGLTPVKALGNLGRATARNALATQLWAARTGDIDLEACSITFGAEVRAKLEALEATLPDALHSEYDTPEKVMAFMLAGSRTPSAEWTSSARTTWMPTT